MSAAEMQLTYRHSVFSGSSMVITSVTMELVPGDKAEIKSRMEELMQRRRDKQPLNFPSAGSTFKRPVGHFAGQLIEQAGLKGTSVGAAQVSEKHAGFLINRGGATCDDMLRLIELPLSEVLSSMEVTGILVDRAGIEQFGVELECEVRIVK